MSAGLQSPRPADQIEQAFSRFKQTVSPSHARNFSSTELKDVWTAAREVEQKLAAKQMNRNLTRIQPLLKGIEHYSKVVEVLCNGTPYLPWIWAPIKLMLQIASDYVTAFEKLIDAYGQIAETLPRFDRLSAALRETPDFQNVLAVVYADIVEFHRRAYKFFTATGWKRFFDSAWSRFDDRFKGILDSLRKNADLVDREANSHQIVLMLDWRAKALEDIEKRLQDNSKQQFVTVLNWLDAGKDEQENQLDTLAGKCHRGTCDWLFQQPKVISWLDDRSGPPVLWLKGKPGSGKRIGLVSAYYLFDYRRETKDACSRLLRSIAAQLIRGKSELSTNVYDAYLSRGRNPSILQLRQMIPELLDGITSARLIIDGLDESPQKEHRAILDQVLQFTSKSTATNTMKLAIISQDVPSISEKLSKKPIISLKEAADMTKNAIQLYVHESLEGIRDDLYYLSIDHQTLLELEGKIVAKSDAFKPTDSRSGMFLWARLVLSRLQHTYTIQALHEAVDGTPEGLEAAFILHQSSGPALDYLQAQKGLAFACAAYMLHSFELIDPDVSEERRIISVANGFHSLQNYAYAHWTDHLLIFAEKNKGLDGDHGNYLLSLLHRLYQRHIVLQTKLNLQERLVERVPDPRLNYLNANHGVRGLVEQVLRNRATQLQQQREEGLDLDIMPSVSCTDLLILANNSYQQITSTLMAGNAENPVPYVGLDQLLIYQSIYGDSAYLCRVPGCLREPNAFATEDERRQHESTHAVRYTCKDLSCQYATIGFTTTKKLKQHETEFHPRELHAEIPTVLGHHRPSFAQEAQSETTPEYEGNAERTAGSITKDVGSMLGKLKFEEVEPRFKEQGVGWSAVFNPKINRTLDIELAQTFQHTSPVVAVCFSEDGHRLVTANAVEMEIFLVQGALRLSRFRHPETAEGVVGRFTTVCFHSVNTRYLITGHSDGLVGTLEVHSLVTRKP
ncbi:hypothetical protein LTR50_000075 [Elasticomyces elasticus]|nr:hypothetical protein LTR50_000075 [Elasticomyces elasticus]